MVFIRMLSAPAVSHFCPFSILQKLLKKQSAIEADIRGREPRVQKAFGTANDMIAANVRTRAVIMQHRCSAVRRNALTERA